MGQVSSVPSCFLGLRLAVRQELVDLLRQWPDLDREFVADARLVAGADVGDFVAYAAQRPQPVESLQRREHQEADAQREEAPEEGEAQASDLVVDALTRLSHLEAPADR